MAKESHGNEILVLTNYPSPYRVPLYNKVADKLRQSGAYRLTVYFATEETAERRWRVDRGSMAFEVCFGSARGGARIPGMEFRSYGYGGLLQQLRKRRPALVLVDGFSLGALKTLLSYWLYGQRYAICSEAIDDEADYLSSVRRVERRLIGRYAVGGLVMGSLAQRYLVGLGVREDRLAVALNTVDTEFYRPREGDVARKPGPFRFVSVGSLIPRKGYGELLDAAERLAMQNREFIVDVCGEGPQRVQLEQRIRRAAVAGRVRLRGHMSAEHLRELLRDADCFVFPSRRDVWGLAVNEAMAVGLPVLSSQAAGATHDLVRDGETGFALDFRDPDRVAARMAWMIDNPTEARHMGQAARAHLLREASLERSAAAWVDGLDVIVGKDRVADASGQSLLKRA